MSVQGEGGGGWPTTPQLGNSAKNLGPSKDTARKVRLIGRASRLLQPFRSRESQSFGCFASGRDHLASVHRIPRAKLELFQEKLLFINYISGEKG